MMRNSIPCIGIIRIRYKGFDLSLSFIPLARKRHPYWYRRQKYSFFLLRRKNNGFFEGIDILGWSLDMTCLQNFSLTETSDMMS